MRWRDEEWRERPGPGTTLVRLLTSAQDYSRDHWECAIIRCLGPGDCQHPSPVARPWANKWSHTRDHNIPMTRRPPSLSPASLITPWCPCHDQGECYPHLVAAPIFHLVACGGRSRENLKTRFLAQILSKYLLIQFPHSTLHLSADNFIGQLKFYRGNVIPVSDYF
mgnify:CR=1 FL=1